MATFEITIEDEKIQDLLQNDRGMAALLEPILNQLLQAEMTEHLRAEPGERTDQRRGWRNGSYKRRRAQSLLGAAREARSDVVARYEAALSMEGDVERGRAVYERACAACHQVNGAGGVDFGPDLASVRNRAPEDLLVDILMPNEAIAAGYGQWRIERRGSAVVQGGITTELPARSPCGMRRGRRRRCRATISSTWRRSARRSCRRGSSSRSVRRR